MHKLDMYSFEEFSQDLKECAELMRVAGLDCSICEFDHDVDECNIGIVVRMCKSLKDNECVESLEDPCSVIEDSSNMSTRALIVYHILYSSIYSMPVLYFNAHNEDGECIIGDELWKFFPNITSEFKEKWAFVVRTEHPFLSVPYFFLHPCRTSDVMSRIWGQNENKKCNFLFSWMSNIASVMGLDLPAVLARNIEK